MKLAYQQLSVDEKKREEKQKTMDPKKAEQFERLGMGIGMGEAK
jgi:ADP-ribosylation factor GTPase-activating protein 2/3